MSRTAPAALVVVDVQQGFDDPSWGTRNNPAAEDNIARLVRAAREAGLLLVVVRHDSSEDSPLRPGQPGNDLKPALLAALDGDPDVLVTKSVNSAFHGEPDLEGWLRERGVERVYLTGITTNHCVDTTARVGGNLGFDVRLVLDATHTFDRTGPDGTRLTADELATATAVNLHDEFATVVGTDEALRELAAD